MCDLKSLVNRWKEEAATANDRMLQILGSHWYSSLSDEERKEYRILQATYNALRDCANELEALLKKG